ncbi:YadA-like family protein [Halomonas huangheensis]|nr:YadA-like family protein [Halomonas huangheensis]
MIGLGLPIDYSNDLTIFGAVAIGTNAEARSRASVVIGAGSIAESSQTNHGVSTVLGAYSYAGSNNNVVLGNRGVATGWAAMAVGRESASLGNNAIAFGNVSSALGNGSVAMGQSSLASGARAIAIGSADTSRDHTTDSTQALGIDSLAFGTRSVASQQDAVAFGRDAAASGIQSVAIGTTAEASANQAVAIGNATQAAFEGTAIGGQATSTGESSVAIGVLSDAQGNNSLAVGGQAVAAGIDSLALGREAFTSATATSGIAIGSNAEASAENAFAAGSGSQASGPNSLALGTGAVASGEQSISIGTGNTVSGNGSGAIGDPTTITGDGSYSLGNDNTIAADNAGTFGNDNVLDADADGSRIIGNGNDVDVADAFVIGNGADVTVAEGVALGNGSIADTSAGVAGYNPATGAADGLDAGIAATQSTTGALAVGDAGGGVFRQITGVAAGTEDSDAVNVAQLKGVEDLATTPLTFAGDSGSNVDRQLGETLNVTGGAAGTLTSGNIGVVGDGTDTLELQLAEDIDLGTNGSVTAGDSLLDTDGLTVTDGTTTTAMTAGGVTSGNINLDGTSNEITGLSNTTLTDPSFATEGRAATEEQLDLVNQTANTGWNLTAEGADGTNVAPGDTVDLSNSDGNLVIAKNATDGAQEDVTFDLADDVTIGNSLTINNGPTINDNGIDMGGDKITNVGGPTNGGDAVNLDYFNENKAHYYSVNDGGTQGGNYANDGATGINAIASGVDASATADGAIAMGSGAEASALRDVMIGDGAGDNAGIGGRDNIAIGGFAGQGRGDSGSFNVATGFMAGQNVTGNGNAAYGRSAGQNVEGNNNLALGTGAGRGTDPSLRLEADRTVSIGNGAQASADDAIAIGSGAQANGLQAISIGTGNQVDGDNSGAIGDPTTITGNGSYSLGNDNTIAVDNAGTFGNDNVLDADADGSRIIGNGNDVDVADAFVIGNGADVTVAEGVALGNGSIADTSAGVAGYNPATGAADGLDAGIAATQSTTGALAVGDAGGGVFRQITGVAAGTEDSDAVNVAQLKGVEDLATTPLTFAGDSGSNVDRQLGETLNVTGGAAGTLTSGNIGVVGDGTDTLELQLAEDIDLGTNGSVTAGDSLLDTDGLTVTDGTTTTAMTAGGVTSGNINLDGTSNEITGLSNTTLTDPSFATEGRAATEEQLDLVNQTANTGWNLTAEGADGTNVAPGDTVDLSNSDGNLVIAKNATDGAQEDVTFDLADDVTIGNSLTINNGPTINDNGIDMGGDKITNVGGPTNGGDAVNLDYFNENKAHYYSVNDGGTQGGNYANDGATGINALAAGVDAEASGENSTSVGYDNSVASTDSSAIGLRNTVSGSYPLSPLVPTEKNTVVGVDNTITNSTRTTTFGGGNTITGSIYISSIGANNTVDGGTAVGIYGIDNEVTSGSFGVSIMGGQNEVVGSSNSFIVGRSNTVSGSSGDLGIFGAGNQVIASDSLSVVGDNNTLDTVGANGPSGVHGSGNTATGASSFRSIGNDNSIGADGAMILGNATSVSAANGVALGSGASVSAVDSVALGSGSVADGSTLGSAGYQPFDAAGNPIAVAAPTAASEISVGDAGSERRITNVAAGAEDTDAVNISQLQAVEQLANTGWNLTAEGADGTNVAPGDTVDLSNSDGNLVIAKNATDGAEEEVTFDLADDITVDSVTAGDSLLDTNGLTVDDGAGNVASTTATGTTVTDGTTTTAMMAGGLTSGNINLDGTSDEITGLSNTDLSAGDFATAGRAATEEQLDLVNQTANTGWNLTAEGADGTNVAPGDTVDLSNSDGNLVIAKNATDGAEEEVTFDLADDITVDSVTAGDSLLDTNGLTVDDGAGNVASTTATGTTVTDGTTTTAMMAGGVTSGNINLDGTSNEITGLSNTTLTDPSFATEGRAATEEQLDLVNQTANTGWNLTAEGADGTNVAPGDTVDLSNTDGNLVIAKNATDGAEEDVTFDLADDITVDSVTAGDSLLDTNGLTVDDGTGNVASTTATGTTVTDGTTTTAMTAGGLTSGNINLDGTSNEITGLSNTTLTDPGFATEGRAATEEQLDLANQNLTDQGLNFSGDSGTDVHRDLGQTLNLNGGADASGNTNIRTVANGTDGLAIVMTDQPTFGDVTVNTGGGGTINELSNLTFDPDSFTSGQAATEDQLAAVSEVANTGWNLTAEGTDGTNVAPGDTVDLSNTDGNLVIAKNATDGAEEEVTFDLADDITVDSVTAGDSLLDTNGLTVDDGTGNVASTTATGTTVTDGTTTTAMMAGGVTSGNINLDGTSDEITGLSNTTLTDPSFATEGRAATEEQLDLVNQNLTDQGLNFSGDSGTDVHRDLGQTLNLNGGADASGNTNISTVANGTDGLAIVMTDQPTFGDVTVNTGGGGTINELSNLTFDPDSFTSGQAATEDQLAAVSDVANTGWNLTAEGADGTNVAPGDTVDLSNSDGNLVIAKNATDGAEEEVTFDLADDVTISNSLTVEGDTTVNGDTIVNGDTFLGDNFSVVNNEAYYDGPITDETHIVNKQYVDDQGDASAGGGFGLADASDVEVKEDLGQTIKVYDPNGDITTTADNANGELQLGLSSDLSVGGPGADGADGEDGYIGIDGADGETGVGIDGSDGSIGLRGPAGTEGQTPELTLRPTIEPGDVVADDTDVTRLSYEDGDGNNHTVATLENDGLRFSGNDNTGTANGQYLTRNLNEELPIIGGAQTTGDYSSDNIKTVATEAGGIEVRLADSPQFGNVTINDGDTGRITGITAGTEDSDAVNVSQLNDVSEVANTGWNLTAEGADGTNVAPGDTVDLSNSDGNLVIAKNATDDAEEEVTFDLADDVTIGNSLTVEGDTTVNGDTIVNGDTFLGDNFSVVNNEAYYDGPITEETHIVNKQYVDDQGDASAGGGFGLADASDVEVKEDLGQTIKIYDPNGDITTTADNANGELQLGLSSDLSVGGPGADGADGEDGYIGIDGADGETGVGIDGSDGSIGLRGPAGADGQTPELTLRPTIEPGDVVADDTDVTRLSYEDGDGNNHTVATLENDGLRFSGNDNTGTANGQYLTRNLNEELPIVGGAQTAGNYSSDNINTVATEAGGIEVQLADSPKFGNVTINDGDTGRITGVTAGTEDNDAVNVSQLNDVSEVANTGWNLTAEGADGTNVAPGNTVDLSNSDGNLVIAKNATDGAEEEVTFDLADDVTIGNSLTVEGDTTVNGDTIVNGDTFLGDNFSVVNNEAYYDGPITDETHIVNKQYVDDQGDASAGGGFGLADASDVEVKEDLGQTIKIYDPNGDITTTADNANGELQLGLSSDLSVGGPGADGADGEDGYIGIDGADGETGVGIDGSDGSIGLRGPAGADGQTPELTLRPTIEPGDVVADDTDVTRLSYEDGDGNNHTVATLENDGLRFSGNDNTGTANGQYLTRNLNEELPIVGGAQTTGDYSSDNIKTVATEAGGIEVQLADSPQFGNVTINDGDTGRITGVTAGTEDNDAVNVSQLNDVSEVANTGWNLTAEGADGTNVAPGNTVDLSNTDGNLVIAKNATDGAEEEVTFDLADDVTIGNSLTVEGDTTVNGDTIVNGDTFLGDNFSVVNNEAYYDGPITEETHIVNKQYVDDQGDASAGGGFGLADASDVEVKEDLGQTIKVYDPNGDITTTADNANGELQLGLSSDLSVGGPGADGADGEDGYIGIDGADGETGVGIDGSDGSIGLRGPAGADGQTSELTLRPTIEPGDVVADDTDVTRLSYEDGDGNNHTVATLENDGLRFSGNDNTGTANGQYLTRNLNEELPIIGGAQTTGDYSSDNIKTVATEAGGIEVQLADSPKFGGVTINDGDTGRITGVTAGTEDNDAVNVSQLNDVSEVANTGWELRAGNGTASNVAPGGEVHLDNDDDNLDITRETRADGVERVNFALSDNVTIANSLTVEGDTTVNGDTFLGDNFSVVNNEAYYDGPITEETHIVNKQYVDDAGNDLTTAGMNFSGNEGDSVHRDLGQTLAVTGEASADGTFSGTNLKTVTDPDTGAIQLQMADAPQFGDVTINDGGSGKISGVADGDINAASTDAVNGSQLWEAQQALEGEQVHYYSVNDGGTQSGNYANDGATGANAIAAGVDATATADGAIAIGAGATASEAGSVALGAASTTDAVVGTAGTTIGGQTYTFAGAAPIGTLSVGTAGAERTITHVAAGRISADSTDAVNGSQLYATNQAVESIDNRVGDVEGDVSVLGDRVTNVEGDVSNISNDLGELADQAVKYDTNDDGSVNYESVTLAGGEGTTITNLADGEVSEGSSDVVNGSQLWAVQNQINNSLTTGETKYFKANSEAAAARAEGAESVAMGPESVAAGDNSVAVGNGARAESDGGVALGAGSQATREGMNGAEEAFSNESVASTQGAVSVGSQGGERQITHVAGGTEATDAVNVRQLKSVQAGSVNYDRHSDGSVDYSSVTLGQKGTPTQIHNVAPGIAPTDAANVGQLQELNQQFSQQFGSLNNRIDDVEDQANAGTASALAAASVPQAYLPGKSMVAAGAGTYNGESAMAVGVSRLSDNGRWAVKLNATGDTQSNFGAGVGVGFHW